MDRRRFLLTSLAGALVQPLAAETQQPRKLSTIALLALSSEFALSRHIEAFRKALRELGYVEGENVETLIRSASGKLEQLVPLAAELARLNVEVIVTQTTPAAEAAKLASSTIPIVMATGGDPVGAGLVASLARPGGNVTGLSLLSRELMEKRLDLLKELAPKVARVAFLGNSAIAPELLHFRQLRDVSKALGLALEFIDLRANPTDFEAAFVAMSKARADAVLVAESATNREHRARIADLAAARRIPAMSGFREFAEAGGLMALGPHYIDLFRRAAVYVAKILMGAKPADLPVEQPTTFELAINVKTAKALGLTIPPSLLARADQVIE